MIEVRRATERRSSPRQSRESEAWLTFYPEDLASPFTHGFGALEFLDESVLPPGGRLPARPTQDAEILTYVCEGAIAYTDTLGRSGVLRAGEFQRMTAARGLQHSARNASRTEWARTFRVWLRPSRAGIQTECEQRRFSAAECRDVLRLIASPDARGNSLRVHEDTSMYAALLQRGMHVVHELSAGRGAWLHVVQGEVVVGDLVLTSGDGAGFTAERAVSLTAREEAAILLFDVGEPLSHRVEEGRVELLPTVAAIHPRFGTPTAALSSGEVPAPVSGTDLFAKLWTGLVDILGTVATATVVGRAARRALPRNPELGELAISRVAKQYGYTVPRSFDRTDGMPDSLRALLAELQPLLVELTGGVVLRRFEEIPQLREWASIAA